MNFVRHRIKSALQRDVTIGGMTRYARGNIALVATYVSAGQRSIQPLDRPLLRFPDWTFSEIEQIEPSVDFQMSSTSHGALICRH